MGDIPAGGTGPPPPARLSSRAAGGATGTSSSAVKSIVAACSVLASCCSIAASRVRAAALVAPPKCMAALRHAVGYLRRARRPSTSFASSPTASFVPRSSAQGVRLPIVVGVAALTHAKQGTVRLTTRNRGQRGAKPSCTQLCCPYATLDAPLLGEQSGSSRVPALPGLARVQLWHVAKRSQAEHYCATETPRLRLSLRKTSAAERLREQ